MMAGSTLKKETNVIKVVPMCNSFTKMLIVSDFEHVAWLWPH
jgi:hypothetical protein